MPPERLEPLGGGVKPQDIAHLLDYLTSPENTMITGQVIFIDNGSDAVMRGDDIWRAGNRPLRRPGDDGRRRAGREPRALTGAA